MLIFACPEGIKFHHKSSLNHIKINHEIYIDKRYQNISKNLPVSVQKPSKMGWVEVVKSTSDQKGASKTSFKTNITPKYIQRGPMEMTKTVINGAPDHEIG